MSPTAADEGRHGPSGEEWFEESWYFDFARADGTGGYVRLGQYPNRRVAWYWAYFVSPEHGLVTVRDHEVPLPRGEALEIRAEALWGECVCETPMEHWSLGLEAFGVRLEQPGDAYRGEVGERLPLGLDLEWEAVAPVFDAPRSDAHPGGHYEHAGVVHGEVLVGPDRIEFEGPGQRNHGWGRRDWWGWGWHWGAFQIGEELAVNVAIADETPDATGYVWRLGEGTRPVSRVLLETHHGTDDLPVAARYVIDHELAVDVEVVAVAPVPVFGEVEGRDSRLPRALCRFTIEGHGAGTGWCEWLQPGRPAVGA